MIKNSDKKKIADLIEKLDNFIGTTFTKDVNSNEDYNTYEALEMFDTIIVRSEYTDRHTDDTEYFIFNGKTLRKLEDVEDTYLREGDGVEAFRDLDVEFIICRSLDGIKRFDNKESKIPKRKNVIVELSEEELQELIHVKNKERVWAERDFDIIVKKEV